MSYVPFTPVQFTVLATVASLLMILIAVVIISTETDARIDPRLYRPLVSPRVGWTLLGFMSFINIALWAKVVLQWINLSG